LAQADRENGETLRAALLAQRVRPFILRRRKQDVAGELPPRTEVIQRVQLQGEQRELYESVRVAADVQVRRVLQRQSFNGAQISILDALLKLRQVCCDPHLVKGSNPGPSMERAKLELLADMLPTLVEEGRRVLIFSQFTELLDLITQQLRALNSPFLSLTGKTPTQERGHVVQRFQAHEVPLLLLSLKAGGIGLNLTAADTVIHMDPWWNLAVEEQATARAHRIGRTARYLSTSWWCKAVSRSTCWNCRRANWHKKDRPHDDIAHWCATAGWPIQDAATGLPHLGNLDRQTNS
jgi:SNF2 family DNA or RNA helicase